MPGPERARRLAESLVTRPGYHSPQIEVEVKLNTNESPEGPPAAYLEELAEIARRLQANRYPDREAGALRGGLAELHGVSPEEVFCANGSNEALLCLLLAFGGPGKAALVFEPTYALHAHIAQLTGTEVLRAGRGAGFEIELDEALRQAEANDPALVFSCSPNNPTGNCEKKETLAALSDQLSGLLVVDEAYGQFSSWSALELRAAADNVVVVRTFSKTWALAGLRLGYLVADPAVVAACFEVALPYHLDSFKQAAGLAALSYEKETEGRTARLVAERERLAEELGRLPVELFSSESNFLLFRPLHMTGKAVWEGLLEHSVLVRDVTGFPGLEDCLRVTVGTPAEDDTFLAALAEVLGGHR